MATTDLDQLLEMGFEKERAELALKKTGNLNGALEWIEKNQDKSIEEINSEEPAESSSAAPNDDAAQSLVCDDCGKKFRNSSEAEYHATKTQHTNFSQSTDVIAPLTEEEKKEKLAALRAKMSAKRAAQSEQDKIDQKRNEEIRRKSTKETQDIKEDLQKKEQMKEAEKKRREKAEEVAAKQRIKAKIEADKEERRQKAAREKALREGQAPPTVVTENPIAPKAAPKPASAYTEARLRLQTPSGNLMKTYPVDTTLFEVAAAVGEETGLEVSSFMQSFPKKVWDREFFGETLKELGLVPSASLVVK